MTAGRFVDIHCHLAPGIDDGAKSWEQSLEMARLAVSDGFEAMICTPHQLGNYGHNSGEIIRRTITQLQQVLTSHRIPLKVLPGADVRIEPCMYDRLKTGDVLSLGDHRKHVLLELPHEIYIPLEGVLDNLERMGMVGILSHPERNQGIMKEPGLLPGLVERGCLMQVTAGSLMGTFGPISQQLAESMLTDGQVHFLATDAHGPKSRRPLMRRAYEKVAEMLDQDTAELLCCQNPKAVLHAQDVEDGFLPIKPKSVFSRLFSWKRAA